VFVEYAPKQACIALLANEEPEPLIVSPAKAGAAENTPATTAAEAAIEMIFFNIFLLVG
jgi:hypothetical protein